MSEIIGIDLGTTNSTLSATCSAEPISLPSFFLFPLPEEGESPIVGERAKERGEELPDRVIASAKSWLTHDGVNRRERFLPLSDLEEKRSPVEVSAAYLTYFRERWNSAYPELPFDVQEIFITVPASFDPGARALVQEAAELAGFPEATLLEEPLAAFYAWLEAHRESWRDLLHVGDSVLVVDIGGGTTDFSLITVQEEGGELTLERKAVGEHLLLGGDNIDLALAYFAKEKLGQEIDEWQFQSLVHACRRAKETLLGENSPESLSVTIQGRGSGLVGGSLTATLAREEVKRLLVDGFFPLVSQDERAVKERRAGLSEQGLPYVRDPRISAQLATFLGGGEVPTAVLFNGGTMKAKAFQERILEQLNQWGSVRPLPGADLDFGVSRGAVRYGKTRAGEGIRVRAGTGRSYYIGVEGAAPAVPGIPPPFKAICVVPLGMEEGSEERLDKETFTLLLGEPVAFRFFSSSQPSSVGEVVMRWQERLRELHPLETVLSSDEEERQVEIQLQAKVTELGVLELWCVSKDGRRWKLEFDLRKSGDSFALDAEVEAGEAVGTAR